MDQMYQVLMKYGLPEPYGTQTKSYKPFKPFNLATSENKPAAVFEDEPQKIDDPQTVSMITNDDREVEKPEQSILKSLEAVDLSKTDIDAGQPISMITNDDREVEKPEKSILKSLEPVDLPKTNIDAEQPISMITNDDRETEKPVFCILKPLEPVNLSNYNIILDADEIENHITVVLEENHPRPLKAPKFKKKLLKFFGKSPKTNKKSRPSRSNTFSDRSPIFASLFGCFVNNVQE